MDIGRSWDWTLFWEMVMTVMVCQGLSSTKNYGQITLLKNFWMIFRTGKTSSLSAACLVDKNLNKRSLKLLQFPHGIFFVNFLVEIGLGVG